MNLKKLIIKDRIVTLFGVVNQESVEKLLREILTLWRADHKQEIILYVCSEGGENDFGFTFYDIMRLHNVNLVTIAVGSVNSLGVVIWAAGKKRLVAAHSTMFLHLPMVQLSQNRTLNTDQLKAKEKRLQSENNIWCAIIENISGLSAKRIKRILRKEKTLLPKELIKLGLAHKVI